MIMSRSILMMVLIASSSINVNAQQKNRDRYFDDFRGQRFCANRQRTPEGTCCASRFDECSVPIAGETYDEKIIIENIVLGEVSRWIVKSFFSVFRENLTIV